MVFIQSDSECAIYATSDAIIAVAENSDITPDIVKCKLLNKALFDLSEKLIDKQTIANRLRLFSQLVVYVVKPTDIDLGTIANIIADDTL